MRFNIIVAHDSKRGIGKDGDLPWKLREDFKNFSFVTSKVQESQYFTYVNALIMGRKTWESLPKKPLPNRLNVVMTHKQIELPFPLTLVAGSLEDAFNKILAFNKKEHKSPNEKIYRTESIFVIGGEQIYNMGLKHPDCDIVYTTEIYTDAKCDRFFAKFPELRTRKMEYQTNRFEGIESFDEAPKENENTYILQKASDLKYDNGLYYRFFKYQNQKFAVNPEEGYANPEEQNYIGLMHSLIHYGIFRDDRTGTGTYSLPGQVLKYDLRTTFPISTSKRIFFRAIFEELMMYLRGQTNSKILAEKNIHVWDGNTSREFLDKRGLSHLPEGDMGETYGFNFRHFGAKYVDCLTDYTGQGYDQLANVIDLLKNDPTSRRILITLWNPATTKNAALPSCLEQYQFWVDTDRKELHLIIYLRSSDYFLANNWNTCTGALLVHLLCNTEGVNLHPGSITVCVGDCHLYKTHLKGIKTNLERRTYPYPKLVLKTSKKNVEDFQFEDLQLVGYKCHPRIEAPMAV